MDERFGDRSDLVELVREAHDRQLRVVLDVIVNHSGDNWAYVPPGRPIQQGVNEPPYRPWPSYYGDPANSETAGWTVGLRDERQQPFTVTGADVRRRYDGVWPRELQDVGRYTRAGRGDLGAGRIDHPHAEHKRTDFLALKDFALDVGSGLADLVGMLPVLDRADRLRRLPHPHGQAYGPRGGAELLWRHRGVRRLPRQEEPAPSRRDRRRRRPAGLRPGPARCPAAEPVRGTGHRQRPDQSHGSSEGSSARRPVPVRLRRRQPGLRVTPGDRKAAPVHRGRPRPCVRREDPVRPASPTSPR